MKTKPLPSFLLVIATFAALALLPSCETTEGFGEDLQDLGENIERKANQHGN